MMGVLICGILLGIVLLAWAVYLNSKETKDLRADLRILPSQIAIAFDDRIKLHQIKLQQAKQEQARTMVAEEPKPNLAEQIRDEVVAKLTKPVIVKDDCDKCHGDGVIAREEPPPLIVAILDAYRRLGIPVPKPPKK